MKIKEFIELLKAEFMFVYGDVFRRKSLLLLIIIYPYMFTFFVLLLGSAMGSTRVFISKVGVDPVEFFIVASYVIIAVLSVTDDILWRPIYDENMGTLPYIISSPVSRIALYVSMPLPRLTITLVTGAATVLPVLTYYRGAEGALVALIVIGMAAAGGLLFSTLAMLIMGTIYSMSGESWRVLNVIRPLLMILLGAFYPRYLMPLGARVLSWVLPPSHPVAAIQLILVNGLSAEVQTALTLLGIGTALAVLYAPLGRSAVLAWERRKLRSGVGA